MGIVIAMGARVPVEPRVRAYVWGWWSGEEPAAIAPEPFAMTPGH